MPATLPTQPCAMGSLLPDQAVNPSRPTVMDHVVGRVFMLSKSQNGSRFVQEKLSDPVYFNVFFAELKTRVAELMMDNFGHYAIEGPFSMFVFFFFFF